MSTPVTLPLSQPIEAHDKTLHELVFQPLRGKHLRRFASPLVFSMTDGEPSLDTRACVPLITELAGIPASSVDQLSPYDFAMACAVIAGFFTPAGSASTPPSSSTSTTTAPSSSATMPASLT